MSKEDELATAIMDRNDESDLINTRFELEVHYNYYGDRGVVDLVEEQREGDGGESNREIWVYELKSESAIEQVTGANEVIRQFKRHRNYFFKGSDYTLDDYYSVNYALVFYATKDTYDHVEANEPLYQTLIQNNPDKYGGTRSCIIFYHPSADGYAHYFNDFWGVGSNSRSILRILGREDEFVDFEKAIEKSERGND